MMRNIAVFFQQSFLVPAMVLLFCCGMAHAELNPDGVKATSLQLAQVSAAGTEAVPMLL